MTARPRPDDGPPQPATVVVCGTDFSPSAAAAAGAAAALAKVLGGRLELVHVVDGLWSELPEAARAPLLAEVGARLRTEAERLRTHGVEVREEILHGLADEALVARAEAVGAALIVVSSTGRRAPARWVLGSVAERTAQTAVVPVLVVRQATPLIEWAEGKRNLRVLVAADFSDSSEAALDWVARLRAVAPCDVVLAHSAWPPEARARFGGSGPPTGQCLDPDVAAALRADLERRAARLGDGGDVRVRVESCLGQAAAHLVDMAVGEGVDLIVTGTHQRDRVGQFWHGSVSRGVLHGAPLNVACVPLTRRARPLPPPEIRTVLAATDFSELGDRAVSLAYAVAPAGGTVHLVHVVERPEVDETWYAHYGTSLSAADRPREAREPELTGRLQGLVPDQAAARGIETRIHIIEARTAGAAIAMAARRLAADLICVGSHGRSGLSAAVVGSVAQALIARGGHPVLVAGPSR
ncbi:MAG TPA: universal stress protein [Calidithermus sp.]|nr:universal stress protein [Calidithermus sp.]